MLRPALFLLLLFGTLSSSLFAAESPPSAAACVIRHQQTLLLVQDRISDRYSLSGGYIDGGETSTQAALRELFEETGLHGRITGELGRWQRATVFACQTLTPIRAQRGSGFVSLLEAPNLGGEILNARLIDAASLPHDQRRFPTQLDWLAPRLAQVPESKVQWVPDFSTEGNVLHRAELPLIQRLQRGRVPRRPPGGNPRGHQLGRRRAGADEPLRRGRDLREQLPRLRGVEIRRAEAVRLEGGGIPVQADGDAAGGLPVSIDAAPRPMRIVLP